MKTLSQKKKQNKALAQFLKKDLGISDVVQIRGREVGLALWLMERQKRKTPLYKRAKFSKTLIPKAWLFSG